MIGAFDIFKIGIGPSSSHTVGPMVAASRFCTFLKSNNFFDSVTRIEARLYGSLAYTGKGHGTDKAVLLGLLGEAPDLVDIESIPDKLAIIQNSKSLKLNNEKNISFDNDKDLIFDTKTPSPSHPNAMLLTAYEGDKILCQETYLSIGGGFVMDAAEYAELKSRKINKTPVGDVPEPFPFRSAAELLAFCTSANKTIGEIAMANELAYRSQQEIEAGLTRIWESMKASIDRGLKIEGNLPGELQVKRRAKNLYTKAQQIQQNPLRNTRLPHEFMDSVSAFAMAVNEENAAGGRVVTSPTNGAAGIIPAVLRYYTDLCPDSDSKGIHLFLLTAAAFGGIIKRNASISGAEGGCQAEVGSASAMAAAGLCAALGGSNMQIENAAEIALEHHLGMTCDPVGGLVQIPCIERNTMGAVKAINAASLALAGDGTHYVSFDAVVETMRQTGKDMKSKYKETSKGGLAVNVVAC